LSQSKLVIAQFSDCHLFADINGLHHGANVYQNLQQVLTAITTDNSIDVVVFTGDLTQDHSEKSYQNFVNAVQVSQLTKPLYFLAGNHDEYRLLDKYLHAAPFNSNKMITNEYWQICLLNTKSNTPAGFVSEESLEQLVQHIDSSKNQLIFTHHHPIDVHYFIDKHGLKNKPALWQLIAEHSSISAIACGHVHQTLALAQTINNREITVLTCPATSIQFDPKASDVKALAKKSGQGVGYRRIHLQSNGNFKSDVIFIDNNE